MPAQPQPPPPDPEREALVVYFPLPARPRPPATPRLPRLQDLIPAHWRRVVIQGKHFWLPG